MSSLLRLGSVLSVVIALASFTLAQTAGTQPAAQSAATSSAPDREAFTITRWQLDVQIVPADGTLSGSGKVTLRNDSLIPQAEAVLQVSSTLAWQSIESAGNPLAFTRRELKTDMDHTGAMSEAVIPLGRAIPPKGTVELDVNYSGTIPLDARRLTESSAGHVPLEVAEASDWDRISGE